MQVVPYQLSSSCGDMRWDFLNLREAIEVYDKHNNLEGGTNIVKPSNSSQLDKLVCENQVYPWLMRRSITVIVLDMS